MVDFPELVAQSRVGLDALAQLHERGFSKIVVASLLGQFGGVTDETGVARGLCILRSLSRHALPGFGGKLSLDSKLLEYLICLVNFAQNSNRKVCATDVALILRYVLQSSINPEALIFDAITRPRTIRFESGLQEGIVAVESNEIQDIDVTILIEALDSPKLPSSLWPYVCTSSSSGGDRDKLLTFRAFVQRLNLRLISRRSLTRVLCLRPVQISLGH